MKCFFPDAKLIEEFWRMTTIAAYQHNRERETDLITTLAIHSFKQLIRKMKSAARVANPIAYFYGILNTKLTELYFEELFELGFSTKQEQLSFRRKHQD